MRFALLLLPFAALAACGDFSGSESSTPSPSDDGGGADASADVEVDAIGSDSGAGQEAGVDAGRSAISVPIGAQPIAITSFGATVFFSIPDGILFLIDLTTSPPSTTQRPFPCEQSNAQLTALDAYDVDQLVAVCSDPSKDGAEVRQLNVKTGISTTIEPFGANKRIPSLAVTGTMVGFVLVDATNATPSGFAFMSDTGGNRMTRNLADPIAIASGADQIFAYGSKTQVGQVDSTHEAMKTDDASSPPIDVARVDSTTFWYDQTSLHRSLQSPIASVVDSFASDLKELVWIDSARELHACSSAGIVKDISSSLKLMKPQGPSRPRQLALTAQWVAVLGDNSVYLVPR